MRSKIVGRFALMLALALLACASAQAGTKTILLKDHINHAWSNELLTYRLEFAPGTCHPSSVRLDGPRASSAMS